MPKREDWLPYSMGERVFVFQRIATVAENSASVLGLSAADVDRIKAIAEEYAFAVTLYQRNRATLKALRTWRDDVASNELSRRPVGERPMFDNTPMPAGTKQGLVAEMRRYVRMIKASPGFNSSIGESMTVLSPTHARTPLRELQPQLKVTAVDGFKVKIACQMEGMSALQVEYRRNGEEKFEKIAILTMIPATIYIEPRVMGVPETGQMRAMFYHKNQTVGQYSSMPSVTLFGA